MQQYLDLLRQVMDRGEDVPTRAMLASTGDKVGARSLLGLQARYDLAHGFPLVTTKKVNFRHVAAELCWFLSGSTNVKPLQDQGVRIWDEWADAKGELGPVYGAQWRMWGEDCDGRYDRLDQIARLVDRIQNVKDDPAHAHGRRLMLLSYNPADDNDSYPAPLGCHTLAQFHVRGNKLSCSLTQRSGDLFLGVPYNIACYALLTETLAYVAGLRAGTLIHTIGDAHIYANHFDQVAEQLSREPKPLPRLRLLPDGVPSFVAYNEFARNQVLHGTLEARHFALEGYDPHPALKGEVAI